jgi:hypothetical protein
MERRTFITSTPMALAGATTLGTATPAQAIGDRSAGRRPETIANPVTGLLPRDKMIASWLSNSSFAMHGPFSMDRWPESTTFVCPVR